MDNKFIGLKIGNFRIDSPAGEGKVGKVFKAIRDDDFEEVRAVKFIPKIELRPNWQNEIKKVVKLALTGHVVRFHEYGFTDDDEYLWISWDFIPGNNLNKILKNEEITIPLIISIAETILTVLFACKQMDVQHGDLHLGNIIIQDQDHLSIDENIRSIWITDFGYCTASEGRDMLDDYQGLCRIISECLAKIDFHKLEGKDKQKFSVLKNNFPKLLLETDSTQGKYVRNPRELKKQLQHLTSISADESLHTERNIADYLAAEVIGKRYDEWKYLFVPEFLASDTILDRNICVVTGLRGCGKTMIFRRLTALYDCHLGTSRVSGADTFLGFYLNARSLAEAFPWLPDVKIDEARGQVIHYFHVSWCLEILEWLEEEWKIKKFPVGWLHKFLNNKFSNKIISTGDHVIANLRSWMTCQLGRSKLGSGYQGNMWELTDLDFLDQFSSVIRSNCIWIKDKPFYFFLDDYSTPLINPLMQKTLNSIAFRRSPNIIFKISTESSESFVPIGLHGKRLEEKDDYVLVDFGMEAINGDKNTRKSILSEILKPRINRHHLFKDRKLTIDSIIGKTDISNTELSKRIRGDGKDKKQAEYYGVDFFCSMWSSDIREMISVFAKMVESENQERLKGNPKDRLISASVQNNVMREQGGRFLSLLEAATNPSDKMYQIETNDGSFGIHLVKIAKAFQEIASDELKHKNSKNNESNPPKQARRIEITEVENELPDNIKDYYTGIIRYGLFTRDTRGKSARGKVVPRLYLRGLLIPYFTLSFSKRDSITMNWNQFCDFLLNPQSFSQKWKQEITHKSKHEPVKLPGF